MKKGFENGDLLPCFKYILENISDGNTTALASFTLSYIQYLQSSGITDRKHIEKSMRKLLLISQHSTVERKKPLDFFTIKGKTYDITDDSQYEAYLGALLALCKNAPVSFSVLYKKYDDRLSMCKLCPMSSQYSIAYQEKELLLARYMFESVVNYNTIISCVGDIEKIFSSYIDIYTVLNNLTKAYSAPLYQLLFKSIYPSTMSYYNPIFGTQEYRAIQKSFIRYLASYGLTNKSKNFEQNFDETIYSYIVSSMNTVSLIDKETALRYREELYEKEKYVPAFEVDSTPSVSVIQETVSGGEKKHSKKKKSSNSDSERNVRKVKGNKVIDIYDAKTPLSDAFDSVSGLKEIPAITDNAYLLEENITITDEVIEVALEKEDIVSVEGEVLIEHLVEEEGVLSYEEDYDDIDMEEDEEFADEFLSEDSGENVKLNIDEVSKDAECEVILPSLDDMDNNKGGAVEPVEYTGVSVSEKKDLDDVPVFRYSDLLALIQLSDEDKGSMIEILYDNQFDSLVSHISNFGRFIIEPASFVVSGSLIDVIILGFEKEIYYIKLSSPYMQRLLDFHKYYAYSVRLICLYSLFEKYNLKYMRKDVFIPLLEELELISHTDIFAMPIVLYMDFLNKKLPSYSFQEEIKDITFPETLQRNIYLYSAYGYSFRHNRFIYHSFDNALSYHDETGAIQFKLYDYGAGTKGLPGMIYDFSFQYPSSDNISSLLTEDIIIKMCKGAFFQKFRLQLLYLSAERIRLYADEYCMDYICNYILMQFFKIGTRYNLTPLNVVVEKMTIDSSNGLITDSK